MMQFLGFLLCLIAMAAPCVAIAFTAHGRSDKNMKCFLHAILLELAGIISAAVNIPVCLEVLTDRSTGLEALGYMFLIPVMAIIAAADIIPLIITICVMINTKRQIASK